MEINNNSVIFGGSVHGSLVQGNLNISSGFYGNSLQLDGETIISLGSARIGCFLSPDKCPNGFTISMWIYNMYNNSETYTDNTYYISSGGHSELSYGVDIFRKKDHDHLGIKTRSNRYHCSFVMPALKWSHLTVTWYDLPDNPVDAVRVYVDGVDESTDAEVDADDYRVTSAYNHILLGYPNSDNTDRFMEAQIDELIFWDEWKSASFVSNVYNHYTG